MMVIPCMAVIRQEDSSAEERYTIQVVTNPDFAPYEYMLSGGFEGIDMDIWKAIAAALDCDVRFNVMDFDSIINDIEAGKHDVGASGFTVTEERKQQINFTTTYSTAHQVIVTLKNGRYADVTDWEQLKGTNIGVESGTTGYYLAVDDFGESSVVPYNTYTDVIQSVLTGYDGCAMIDDLVAESFVKKNSELKILDISIPGDEIEEYAFVINKSNNMMLQYANKALEYLTKEGVIAEIFDYYAGMNYDPEKPGYYTSDPSALSRITAIAHYRPADKYTFEIVTNPDFPPYEYTIADKYYGIDMDIWKAIAAALDCNVHFNFIKEFTSERTISLRQGSCAASPWGVWVHPPPADSCGVYPWASWVFPVLWDSCAAVRVVF